MAVLRSVVVKIGADVSALQKGLEDASKALGKVGKNLTSTGDKLTKGLTLPIAAVGAGLLKLCTDFDEAFDKIRVGTGATGKALEDLQDDFKTVYSSVPSGMGEISQAIADLNTRTGLAGKPLQELSIQMLNLSRITGEDLSDMIANSSRLFGDWSISVEMTGSTMDYLFKVSQSTGIGFNDLNAKLVQFGAPLRQMGFDLETSAAMLGKFEKEGVNTELVLGGLRIALEKMAKFREYVDGKGVAAICKGLERDGIKTISGKTKWHDSVIRKMLRNEKYYGELLLQKTVTLDYLTKLRVVNNNHSEQYKVENNHEPIISKELWDLAQQECERRFAIYSGKNNDRSKYAKRYAFSGKLICGVCGTTYKRRHWNGKNSSAKIVWQCLNYVDKDAKTGKRCSSKRVDDKVLKETFVRVYNEEFRDKSSFFKAFLNNIQKVIEKNNDITPELDRKIAALEADLSGLITLKLHKEIDEKAYGREYQRINKAITDLQMKKSELVNENLEYTKDISKMQAVKGIIGDGSQPLTEFDDALFEAMVEKVIIKSTTEFEFIFESGQRVKAKASK